MHFQAQRLRKSRLLPGSIFDTASFPVAAQMRDLYQSVLGMLLHDDEINFHVMMRPTEFGDRYLLAAGEDPDLDASIERVSGTKVGEHDCIVVLCRGFLSEEKSQAEMMKEVIRDLADFINDNYSMAEPAAGSVGSILSWVTISNIFANLVSKEETELIGNGVEELKQMGLAMLGGGSIQKIGLVGRNIPSHAETIEGLCGKIEANNYGHLSLPLKALDIMDAGRTILSSVLDEREL